MQGLETRVGFARLRDFIAASFRQLGLTDRDALTVASLMAEADLQGSDGHGVIRLPHYVRRIRAGGIKLVPAIRVLQERPGMALLDGDNGMGHLVMTRAAELAVAKARTTGVAWVGARMSNHAGPASLYVRKVLAQDMAGMYFAVGNANHLPPWGGLDMLLSTNPRITEMDNPSAKLASSSTKTGRVSGKVSKNGQTRPKPKFRGTVTRGPRAVSQC